MADILMVEDEVELRELWVEYLAGHGHKVRVEGTVRGAFDALDSGGEGFDAVLVDWTLPDGNGGDVVQHARQCAPGAHVVITSGMGPNLPSDHGADAVLAKPFKIRDLLHAVGIAAGP